MARNTKALVVAVCMMFLNNLYECTLLEGYHFPVFTTVSCPRNKAEWLERSSALNCTDMKGYMCIPNETITVLLEFCYHQPRTIIPKGRCLILCKYSSAVNDYDCLQFSSGCPNDVSFSDEIYKHQSCVSIGKGCFLAEPNCNWTMVVQDETTTAILRNRTEGGKNKQWDIWLWIINVPVIFVLVLVIEVYFVLLNFNLKPTTTSSDIKFPYGEQIRKLRNPDEIEPMIGGSNITKLRTAHD